MNTLLELENVSKTFDLGKGRKLEAVKNVSFSIPVGRNMGIVGESGCGKSTIARMITGLTSVTEGEIRLLGKPVSSLKRKEQREAYRHVQMVFQDPYSAVSPRMSICTFLTEGLVHFKIMSRPQAEQEAGKLMRMVKKQQQIRMMV